jgi:hypothetical protein
MLLTNELEVNFPRLAARELGVQISASPTSSVHSRVGTVSVFKIQIFGNIFMNIIYLL